MLGQVTLGVPLGVTQGVPLDVTLGVPLGVTLAGSVFPNVRCFRGYPQKLESKSPRI